MESKVLLNKLYCEFNDRNLEFLLENLTVDADWPKGMTGERAIGHEAIRAYWTNQWTEINSEVTPISYRIVDGQVIVEVHQLIKSMEGATISDSVVYHSYSFIGGRISRMDITSDVPDFGVNISANPA